jgi:hypothetical protein
LTSDANSNVMLLELPHSGQGNKKMRKCGDLTLSGVD